MSASPDGFNFKTLKELRESERKPQKFYIEKFLAAGQVCIITSAPGVGKSYLTELMAIVIAGGTNWFDKFVSSEAVPVLYILTDGTEDDLLERTDGPYKLGLVNDLSQYNWMSTDMPLNLTTNGAASRKVLSNAIEHYGIKVVFIDSLYSSMEGDPSDGAVGILLAQELAKLKKKHPEVAWVILHHDKKKSLTADGNVMKDPNPFLGSQYLNAMIDQMWNYERMSEQTSAKLTQLKSRSNWQRWDPWWVDIDLETGVLTPQGKATTNTGALLRQMLKKHKGEITTKELEAWADGAKVSRSSMNDNRKALVDSGMLEMVKKGTYRWVGSTVTVNGEERTLDLEGKQA